MTAGKTTVAPLARIRLRRSAQPPLIPPSRADASTSEPQVVLGDRYEIRRRLGSGGMAHVYLAWDRQLEREVAVKVLRRDLASNPREVERFRTEAKLLARVESEHVVQIYDMHFGSDGCYLVLRRLVGSTLDQVVAMTGALGPVAALQLTCEVLLGLKTLHRDGVLHRDIKPTNVLLGTGERAILLDLGVAIDRRIGAQDPPNHTVGTAAYMAPEQRTTGHVDERSEVYQVGLLLLYASTGVDLLDLGGDVSAVVAKAPPSVIAIVERAIAADPERRFQSSSAMYTAALAAATATSTTRMGKLDPGVRLLQAPGVRLPEVAPMVPPLPLPALDADSASANTARASRTPAWIRTGAGIAIIAGTIACVAAWSSSSAQRGAATPSASMTAAAVPTSATVAMSAVTATPIELATLVSDRTAQSAGARSALVARGGIDIEMSPIVLPRMNPSQLASMVEARRTESRERDVSESRAAESEVASAPTAKRPIPTTASEFLSAARSDEHNGATESAIAGYRQYLRLADDDSAMAEIRGHLLALESGR